MCAFVSLPPIIRVVRSVLPLCTRAVPLPRRDIYIVLFCHLVGIAQQSEFGVRRGISLVFFQQLSYFQSFPVSLVYFLQFHSELFVLAMLYAFRLSLVDTPCILPFPLLLCSYRLFIQCILIRTHLLFISVHHPSLMWFEQFLSGVITTAFVAGAMYVSYPFNKLDLKGRAYRRNYSSPER